MKRFLSKIPFSFALLFLLMGAVPLRSAHADRIDDLQAKVDQILATNQKNYQDVAQAMNTMNELRQEFRAVKGTLESADYLRKESERVYQDLDQRVSGLEDRIGQIHNLLKDLNVKLAAQSAGAEKMPPATATSAEVTDFEALLLVANARDYRSAASGFMGFQKKYPKSEMNGSAQYWVAESFYSLGDYTKAISEFQSVATKYPQHPRVKEAIYKQGLSFQKLGKATEAKLFYQKVVAAYPGSAEAYMAQGRLQRMEELEKPSAVALSPRSEGTPPPVSPAPSATSAPSANRPLMKPAPMPRAPLPPSSPEPQLERPTAPPPAQDAGTSSSAPLF